MMSSYPVLRAALVAAMLGGVTVTPLQAENAIEARPAPPLPSPGTPLPLPTALIAPGQAVEVRPAAPAVTIDMEATSRRLGASASAHKLDVAGIIAAYAARGGKPIWMTPKGASQEALRLAAEIGKADAWGLKASAFDLPRLTPSRDDAADLSPEALADSEARLSLAFLKYARHARGGRFEPTALTPFLDRKAQVYDPKSLLDQVAIAADPGDYIRNLNPRHPQFQRLRQKYLAAVPKGQTAEAQRYLANMEQWRWMPDDIGRFHIWVNVPEYVIRVVADGKVVHAEKVVAGKLDTQTPIFSATMEQVIFHPFWGVPDSIKTGEILPSLKKGGSVLKRHNLRLQAGGKDVDPSTIDWTNTDIRRFHVYQAPGGGNVLGVVKFRFPNKHDVYMHDTPSKSLFKQSARAYSHGCMRVNDPVKLAEVILAEDRRMSAERVRGFAKEGAAQNNAIGLNRHIPVHITYFTAYVDEAGKVSTFKDVYGHEERIRLALAGKMNLIKPVPKPQPGEERAEPVGRLSEIKETDWRQRAFSGNSGFGSAGN